MKGNSDFGKALGQVIRGHREKRSWTRKRLAFETGVSVSHIRVIEVRQGNPSISVFILIAEAFGIEPETLLYEVRQRQAYLNDKLRVELQ